MQLGDATELFVLERAGIKRPPDVVVAVTGDDEDNIVICQLARDRYGVEKTIARVNDPRNQPYFDLLGISPTVSATASIMGLIEHEVPEHGLIHLLELRKENLEIVEVTVEEGAACAGKTIREVDLPEGSRVISIVRNGKAEAPGRLDRSSPPATPCSPSSSRARKTSSTGCSSAPERCGRTGEVVSRLAAACAVSSLRSCAAFAAALVGLVGVVSTFDPGGRLAQPPDRRAAPPGWPTAARTLTLALGLALLWIARGLARRKRRAWQLAGRLRARRRRRAPRQGLRPGRSPPRWSCSSCCCARAARVRRPRRPRIGAAAASGRLGARGRDPLAVAARRRRPSPSPTASTTPCCS